MSRPLVLVSAGLDLAGGGSALLGRLCAAAMARFAADAGVPFEILHLGPPADVPLVPPELVDSTPVTAFGTDTLGLARAVAARQLSGRSRTSATGNAARPLLVFDHLGPSRSQALLPGAVRSPYLVFLLGVEAWRPLSWDRRRGLANASALLAISDHTRRRARAYTPSLPRMEVVPLALEEREPEGQADPDLLHRCGENFVLIVGRMSADERYKGHDQLLAAMPALVARHPEARLVIAGGGDDRERLEKAAAERGLEGSVVFAGFVSEATRAELYRRCLVFAMPSRDEGFGLVFLEAMRAAKPCLAALGSAAEEVVEAGRTGLLVDRDDEEALVTALASLYDDPEGAARMGEAGRQRFDDHFRRCAFEERFRPHLESAGG